MQYIRAHIAPINLANAQINAASDLVVNAVAACKKLTHFSSINFWVNRNAIRNSGSSPSFHFDKGETRQRFTWDGLQKLNLLAYDDTDKEKRAILSEAALTVMTSPYVMQALGEALPKEVHEDPVFLTVTPTCIIAASACFAKALTSLSGEVKGMPELHKRDILGQAACNIMTLPHRGSNHQRISTLSSIKRAIELWVIDKPGVFEGSEYGPVEYLLPTDDDILGAIQP